MRITERNLDKTPTEFNRFYTKMAPEHSWGEEEKFVSVYTWATVVWSRSSLFASFTNKAAILPSKYKPPCHLLTHSSFSSFLASSCLYRGLPRTPNWVGAAMRPTQWCHHCYFQQGWAHWRRPQRGWHPSVREQVAEVPTGLALAPVCITSGERIWDGLR